MEYVYAALMLHKLQKEVTEENVTSVVKATGAISTKPILIETCSK